MPRVILPLGPCTVNWNNGEAIFKKTFGGVFFRYEELQAPIQEDQQGLTHIDDVTTGVINPTLEVPLTNEELDKLVLLFANATEEDNLHVSNPVGEAMLANAKRVIIKQIIDGVISINPDQWVCLHRAIPRITMEWVFDNAGQRVTTVLFKGYPMNISGKIGALFRVGKAV